MVEKIYYYDDLSEKYPHFANEDLKLLRPDQFEIGDLLYREAEASKLFFHVGVVVDVDRVADFYAVAPFGIFSGESDDIQPTKKWKTVFRTATSINKFLEEDKVGFIRRIKGTVSSKEEIMKRLDELIKENASWKLLSWNCESFALWLADDQHVIDITQRSVMKSILFKSGKMRTKLFSAIREDKKSEFFLLNS